jgi:hypothetical protein
MSLPEAVVGVAITAVLGIAVVSFATSAVGGVSGGGTSDAAVRATEAAVALDRIATAIAQLETTNPPTSFFQTVGSYPSKLSQLTILITTSDRNSCDRVTDVYSGAALPALPDEPGYVAGWKGPYSIYTFTTSGGFVAATGFTTQDDLVRVPTTPVNNPTGDELAGRLLIRMPSVVLSDALALDEAVDKLISGTSGTVRYGAGDPVTLDYEIRVSGC